MRLIHPSVAWLANHADCAKRAGPHRSRSLSRSGGIHAGRVLSERENQSLEIYSLVHRFIDSLFIARFITLTALIHSLFLQHESRRLTFNVSVRGAKKTNEEICDSRHQSLPVTSQNGGGENYWPPTSAIGKVCGSQLQGCLSRALQS